MAADAYKPATKHVVTSRADGSTYAASNIAGWGVRVALALAIVASAVHLIDYSVFDFRFRWLSLNTHASLFGAVSLLSLASVGTVLLWLGTRRSRWEPTLLTLLSLSVTLLALRTTQPPYVIVVAMPLAVATFALLWWKIEPRASLARRVIRLGCITLAVSYGLHALGASAVSGLGYGVDTLLYQIEVAVEHSTELAGWILIATGLVVSRAAAAAISAGR